MALHENTQQQQQQRTAGHKYAAAVAWYFHVRLETPGTYLDYFSIQNT